MLEDVRIKIEQIWGFKLQQPTFVSVVARYAEGVDTTWKIFNQKFLALQPQKNKN